MLLMKQEMDYCNIWLWNQCIVHTGMAQEKWHYPHLNRFLVILSTTTIFMLFNGFNVRHQGCMSACVRRGIVLPVCYPQVRINGTSACLSPHTTMTYSFYYMTHLNYCINTCLWFGSKCDQGTTDNDTTWKNKAVWNVCLHHLAITVTKETRLLPANFHLLYNETSCINMVTLRLLWKTNLC